ncbi:MAG: von Willebrand factor type A domain-containing protein, partial [Chitinophagales bacterium]
MQKLLFPGLMVLLVATGIIISANSATTTVSFTGTAKVFGIVTENTYGTPVTNADLTLDNKTIFHTDESGYFEINKLEAGNYTLQLTASGYENKSISFNLQDKEIKELNISINISSIQIDSVATTVTADKKEVKAIMLYDEVAEADYAYSYAPTTAAKMSMNGYAMDYEGEYDIEHNTEAYDVINENTFKAVVGNPLSTFSIDVDNASYSNIRRFINYGQT